MTPTKSHLTTLAAALAAGALLAAAPARAAHPLVTDDAGTQGQGKRQLELSGHVAHDRQHADGARVDARCGDLAATLSLGVRDDLDLVIGAPISWSRVRGAGEAADASGPGDVTLELKYRLLERGGLGVAVKPAISLPAGDERLGLGNGAVSYRATLIVSQELGPVSLHLNAAYARDEFGLAEDRAASRADRFHASLAAAAAVAERLTLVANVGAETNPDRASTTAPAFALVGLVYSVTDDLDLDLGVKVGLTGAEQDLAGLAGIASRF